MPQLEITQELLTEAQGILEVNLRTGVYSQTFLEELAICGRYRIVDVYSLLDEIAFLEGVRKSSSTKKAAPFNGPVLKGLWHKHFMDAHFIPKNLANHWGVHDTSSDTKGSKSSRRFMDCLSKARREVEKRGGDGNDLETVLPYLTDMLIFKGYQDRAQHGKLTGEWIVYAPCNGINHYLALGRHDAEDEAIREKVEPYVLATPDLKKSLGW